MIVTLDHDTVTKLEQLKAELELYAKVDAWRATR